MSNTGFNVVFLPGLGADGRLFAFQRAVFPDLFTPPWLPPFPHEALAQYAVRLAGELSLARPLVLGGCSFGGMVAYEMARTLEADALVLIGSVAARSEIPASFRFLGGLSRAVPAAGFGLAQLAAPAVASIFGAHDIEHRRLFVEMLRSSSPEFLRWACIAMHGWKPQPLAGVPIFAIHGDKDHILPLGRRPVDVAVRGGGHLLTLTHPREVNEGLRVIKERFVGTIKT
jgi:pimeloyl-ACP methyl ester carboxylesterase